MITHLRFLVDDPARDVAFYRDVLGLRQVVDVPGVYAELDGGAVRIAFYRTELMAGVVGPAAASGAAGVVVCLRVPSVDAEVARLAARSVLMLRPPHDQPVWHQRVAHLLDPSGRLVELWAPLSPAKAVA